MAREFTQPIAYDIAKNIIDEGEVLDIDAINQSIENILSTSFGERLFLPRFGSPLPLQIFENFDDSSGERILDDILDSVSTWEDRITVVRERASIDILTNENAIVLGIVYVLNESGIVSSFERKIIF